MNPVLDPISTNSPETTPEETSTTAESAVVKAAEKPRKPRGFAAMDRKKQQEIARRGGLAAQALGTAHRFSPEEARNAGRKGGEAVSGNRQHMASIGRRGGVARHALRKARGAESQPVPSVSAAVPVDTTQAVGAGDDFTVSQP